MAEYTHVGNINGRRVYTGASTDTKQTAGVNVLDIARETDTGDEYEFDGSAWYRTKMQTSDGGVGLVTVSAATAKQTMLAATGTGEGSAITLYGAASTYQATADASHTGTTTIQILVSNDGVGYDVYGTMSVTGNSDTDTLGLPAGYTYAKANCSAHGDSTNTVTVAGG